MTKEALRLALEFIPSISPAFICEASHHKKHEQHASNEPCPHVAKQKQVYEAIKSALEANDEPLTENGMYRLGYHNGYGFGEAYGKANAPQRTWVGLDEEDYIKAYELCDFDKIAAFEFFESKLKEKNT